MGRFNIINYKYCKIAVAFVMLLSLIASLSFAIFLSAKVETKRSLTSHASVQTNCKQNVLEETTNADFLTTCNACFSTSNNVAPVVNTMTAKVVMEKESGQILYAVNANVKMEMASTTKIMTALVVLRKLNLESNVKIAKEAVGVEGSSIYLKEGQIFSVQDLLYGLMLRSGNDSATALAIAASGSVDKFVADMNTLARSLNCTKTNFTNPHGLSDPNHYTTARELAVIASEAMRNSDFAQIVATKNYTVKKNDTHDAMLFVNKNKMLASYDGANGIKTGYTTNSGRCLVSAAERDGMQLVCVVLNDYEMWEDSRTLLTQAFNNFMIARFGDKESCKWSIDGSNGEKIEVASSEDICFPIRKNTALKLRYEIKIYKKVAFPIKANEKVGDIYIYNDKCLLFRQKITTIKKIEKIGDVELLSSYFNDLNWEQNKWKG